jgi:hypothetical protein
MYSLEREISVSLSTSHYIFPFQGSHSNLKIETVTCTVKDSICSISFWLLIENDSKQKRRSIRTQILEKIDGGGEGRTSPGADHWGGRRQ